MSHHHTYYVTITGVLSREESKRGSQCERGERERERERGSDKICQRERERERERERARATRYATAGQG